MKNPLISIIVVTFNSKKYIENCLNSVFKISYRPYEILILDNASLDGTEQLLENFRHYENIRIIKSGENLGFAAGCDLAAAKARGKYLFFLNHDTLVAKDFLNPLVDYLEHHTDTVVAQPAVLILGEEKKLNLTGKEVHYLGFDWIKDYLKKPGIPGGEIISFSGSAVLFKKSVFIGLGGFDEYYFMYYEDSDLAWRCRINGYKMVYISESVVFHDYKYLPDENYQSAKTKFYYNERNRIITILKNYQLKTLIIIFPIFLFTELCMIGYSIVSGWGFEKFKSYFSIMNSLRHVFKNRALVQKSRLKSDQEIIGSFKSRLTFKYFNILPVKYLLNPLLSSYWSIAKRII